MRYPSVYLLDVDTYKPPDELKMNVDEMERIAPTLKGWRDIYDDQSIEFQRKVVEKAGLKLNSTYIPKSIHPLHVDRPDKSTERAMEEAQMTMFGACEQLFKKANFNPKDVDILITVCSMFSPTPSLASMIVNKFKMRSDIHSYSLGGMGCGNGVVSVSMARDMLRAHPNSTCLFVVTENVTAGYYQGLDKARLIPNIIFRLGAAAVLLTNKKSLKHKAKYKLAQADRVHIGADDAAYDCIDYSRDDQGYIGIRLSKAVIDHAGVAVGKALRQAIPKMLNKKQLVEGGINIVKRKYLKKDIPEYMPDLTKCCEHYCIHAGSVKIVETIQESLKLPNKYVIPSVSVMKEYGNTSSSSTWYALTYIENFQGLKKGEKVMQIGMGSGMKAAVNVWKAVRTFKDPHLSWSHLDEAEFNAYLAERAARPPRVKRPVPAPEQHVVDAKAAAATLEAAAKEAGTNGATTNGSTHNGKTVEEPAKASKEIMNSDDSSGSAKITSVPGASVPPSKIAPPVTVPTPQCAA